MGFVSKLIRGFDVDRFWRIYDKSTKCKGPFSDFLKIIYMRMATKNGGYIGRETIILSKPILPHGFHGIHISREATIGNNVTIFQNVTIGAGKGGSAIIGDNVMIGANAVIIGGVNIGNNVKIGAGAIVVTDIPEGATVVSPKGVILSNEQVG